VVDQTAILLTAAAAASFVSFAWLALAMDSHWQQVHGDHQPSAATGRVLRRLGSLGLFVSLVICLLADHPTIAVLVWVMLLPATAIVVAMALTWRPALLRPLWPARRG
jgi:Protein of unknown function (DUF3325)